LKPDSKNIQIYSWALYDWANSAFATAVMAGFFPVFFRQVWSGTAEVTTITFRLGLANSIASVLLVVFAPILGAVSDKALMKKRFLLFFMLLGVVMTGTLSFISGGEYFLAAVVYIFATLGFMLGNVIYDALILFVASSERLDSISALGYALGYIGGGIFFAVCVLVAAYPSGFGFSSGLQAVRYTFLFTAVWWAVFSVPLFVYVREPSVPHGERSLNKGFIEGKKQFVITLKKIAGRRDILLFLIAYWLYIDGVDTVVRMAVDYGMSLGLNTKHLITALLITQIVGFPATLAFGKIGQKLGTKKGILSGIAGYLIISFVGAFIRTNLHFYLLAGAVGLVQGGVQSLSRSFFARLVPENEEATFFGFYNMLGKFAAILGPFLMGITVYVSGNPRFGIISVAILFLLGGVFLFFVPEKTD